MISVLIPVYNTTIVQLAQDLSGQAVHLSERFEIIFLDDHSEKSFQEINQTVRDLPLVKYEESTENLGRIKARRALTDLAQGEWCIFLDGDSQVIRPDFLQKYVDVSLHPKQVFTGGRIYSPKEPGDKALLLHWKNGSSRERVTEKKFKGGVARGFMSNNFMIRWQTFRSLRFPDDILGYGHEDTWMGMELQKLNIPVKILDNPVLHGQLEPADIFLAKSRDALKNLKLLSGSVDSRILADHVRIYKWASNPAVSFLMKRFHSLFGKKLEDYFLQGGSDLFLLDLYRLGYFVSLR